MPSDVDSDNSLPPSTPPSPIYGYRSNSVDFPEGIHQRVQAQVESGLNEFRTVSSSSTPRVTRNLDRNLTLSYSDISLEGINKLRDSTSDESRDRLDSLRTVFSQAENNLHNTVTDSVHECSAEIGEYLSADNTLLDSERPESAASVITVKFNRPAATNKKNMAPSAAQKHLATCEKSVFVWNNNYNLLNPKTVPLNQIDNLSDELQSLVADLTAAILYFNANDAPDFTEEMEQSAKVCLTNFNSFRKAMWDEGDIRNVAAATAAAAASAATAGPRAEQGSINNGGQNLYKAVAAQRIADNKESVKATAFSIIGRYRGLAQEKTSSTQVLKSFDVRFKQLNEQNRDCQKIIDDLVKCGMQCGDLGSVTDLDTHARDLNTAQRLCRENIDSLHKELGLLAGVQDAGVNRVKLSPPKFSGEYSAGSLDYYSFKTQLDQFFELSGGFSDAEKCMKLKLECVTGYARECIMTYECYRDAMLQLQTVFGKPELLFSSKAQEIKLFGNCPDGLVDKRNWVLKLEQKLKTLKSLAEKHGINDLFESSNILAVILSSLQKEDHLKFEKQLIKHKRQNPSNRQTKSVIIEELLIFLSELTWEVTAKVDIAITSGGKGYYDVTKAMKMGGKTVHKYSATPCSQPADLCEELDGEPTAVVLQPAFAAAAATPQAAADLVHFGTDKKKGTKKKGGKQKVNQVSDKPAVMMNKSSYPKEVKCALCDGKHVSLAYCEKFQKLLVKKRFGALIRSKGCYKCLRLDAAFDYDNREDWYKEHADYCDNTWVCKVGQCETKDDLYKNHILVCTRHINENMELEQEFRASLDQVKLNTDARFFFAAYHSARSEHGHDEVAFASINGDDEDVHIVPDVSDCPVYLLQYVAGKNNEKLLCFYDSGCYNACISERAYAALDTVTASSGPTTLEVAGGTRVTLPYGNEKFWLELNRENEKKSLATLQGLRMDEVSCKFPLWPLTEAWQEIAAAYQQENPLAVPPAVEPDIGGQQVDIMLGIRYARHYPVLKFTLPSGLSLYEAKLRGYGGLQGVLGGPHAVWKSVMASSNFLGAKAYLSSEFKAFDYQCKALWSDMGVLHADQPQILGPNGVCYHPHPHPHPFLDEDSNFVECIYAAGPGKMLREYQLIDEIGSQLGYRCVKCRSCSICKKGDFMEETSLKEEAEQHQIENSLVYDKNQKRLFAHLPFTEDPEVALSDNTYIAERILSSQLKIANKNEDSKSEILQSFNKLKDKGFVAPLSSLSPEEQAMTKKGGFTIPWRVVHNSNSLSTPTRIVFDGSSRTKTGKSLNDILCKGTNQLSNLLHLLISFQCGAAALTGDIKMAYNSVRLFPKYYKYQKFLWVDNLNLLGTVCVWVVMTLIYGIKSSGNQTIHGLTVVADVAEAAKPELAIGADTVRQKAYMDDLVAAYADKKTRDQAADAVVEVLSYGQQEVKAITKSGEAPSEAVSTDGESVGVLGYVWRPLEDTLSLDIKPLYLDKAKRGKLPELVTGDVKEALKEKFTTRVLLSKTMSVFDPVGKVVPKTSKLKVDLNYVCSLHYDWDVLLPESLLDTWVENLKMIQELQDLRFQRSIFCNPVDVSYGVELIVSTDASSCLAAACVHARMRLLSGGYICRLVTAKSKLIGKSTIPKAEMIACSMGGVLGHLVKRNFGAHITEVIYVTDSLVALYWLHSDTRPLQTGVRNLSIQIRQFSDPANWHHVESAGNVADIATRPDALPDVGENSDWQQGRPWMILDRDKMPIKTIEEVTIDQSTKLEARKEIKLKMNKEMVMANFGGKMTERYVFSKYLINPCKVPWPKYVRLSAVCSKLVAIWRGKTAKLPTVAGTPIVNLTDEEIKLTERKLFIKTTAEVEKFNCADKLKKIGKKKDGVLLHTSRILPGGDEGLAETMLDLDKLAFAKPVLDRYSPVAYSIMKYCHEKLTHHGGSISSVRKSYEIAFILQATSLATEIRNNCVFCKRYKAKTVEVEFGAVDPSRYKVAPAFTIAVIDIFGPVDARCGYGNHKSPLKMWAVVYKCPTTLAVAAYCMQGYDTESFLSTFTRHVARYGIPAKVKIDAGPQLIKAFKEMDVCVADIQNLLNQEKGCHIQFEVCPVKAKNYHGIVERSIQSVKKVLNVVFKGRKFTPIEFETALSYCTNELNSMPVCLGSRYTNLENLDLITPSRLLLGRNNQRAPGGQLTVQQPGKIMESMEEIERAWWNAWKELRVGEFVPKPSKWTNTSDPVKVGDIVIFRREFENALGTCIWRIGRVKEAEKSRDGNVRKVTIEYRIYMEKTMRTTTRSVRDVAVIWKESEVDFVGDLAVADWEAASLLMVRK